MIKNIIANFFGRIWGLISVFIFVPIYIRFLGIELYGLVSFFATLQSVLFLLDLGLSATLRRQFSSGEESIENQKSKYKLLRSIEFCYLIIIVLIICVTYFGAGAVVSKWLNIGNIEPDIAITAIRLMGLSIALQFLSSLYFGGLLGLEKQVIANVYQIGWSTLKNVCVIFILWLISPDIRLFYVWFTFVDLVYLILLRKRIKGELSVDSSYIWKLHELYNLRSIWQYASGIFIISIISALNFQLDKIMISKVLPISELGIYNLAFSLSQLPLILVNAAAISIFSRFVYYYSINEINRQQTLFLLAYRILGIITISISISMCFYVQDLFLVWTGNPEITSRVWVPAIILIAGSMFLTFQIMPFNLVLSQGVTRINTFFGTLNIIILFPLLYFLVNKYGIIGAASSWLIILFMFTPFYNCYIYNKYISKDWLKWLLTDTIYPLLFVFILSFIFFSAGNIVTMNSKLRLLYAIFTGIITVTITLLVFIKNLRSQFEFAKKEIINK